jgi:hypothetical protein
VNTPSHDGPSTNAIAGVEGSHGGAGYVASGVDMRGEADIFDVLPELIRELQAGHAAKQQLCDELEAIADSLPEEVDRLACLELSRRIHPLVVQAQRFEETRIHPILQTLRPGDGALDASLERLRYEHWEDESYAEELQSALGELAKNGPTGNAETAGYMLRGFFEGMRRHIAFEREHLLPILMGGQQGRRK